MSATHTTIPVKALLNQRGYGPFDTVSPAYVDGRRPGDTFIEAAAFDLDIETTTPLAGLLDTVFVMFNVGDCPIATRYRQAGHRSLSAGDVVIIGESAYELTRRDGFAPAHIEHDDIVAAAA